MAVRKIRNAWWVDFRADHLRNRKKSPENSRTGALAYEAMLRQKLARGEGIETREEAKSKELSFAEFAEEWFRTYVVPNNKYSEQYAKRKVLDANLLPVFGQMTLGSINGGHVEHFKAQQVASGVSNKTINNRLAVLGKLLRSAHDWYGVRVPAIKPLKCAPPKTDYLTVGECDQLLGSAEGKIREMIFLALKTGMRQGEIRGLQWSSIDWQSRGLVVRHSRCDRNRSLVSPKSNRERLIPLDADVYEMMYRGRKSAGYIYTNQERNNAPFTCHQLLEQLECVCRKAGLRKITWHVLRHTFATHLILNRNPITVVKELLGHSTITTTMRYSHVPASALRSAIESLNPKHAAFADFGQPVGNAETFAVEKGLQI